MMNLTQEQLAEKLNVGQKALSAWERGLNSPGIEDLLKMSEIFGVTCDALLKEDASERINCSEKLDEKKELSANQKKLISEILNGVSTVFSEKLDSSDIKDVGLRNAVAILIQNFEEACVEKNEAVLKQFKELFSTGVIPIRIVSATVNIVMAIPHFIVKKHLPPESPEVQEIVSTIISNLRFIAPEILYLKIEEISNADLKLRDDFAIKIMVLYILSFGIMGNLLLKIMKSELHTFVIEAIVKSFNEDELIVYYEAKVNNGLFETDFYRLIGNTQDN